jgi:hypothetical protein
MDVKTQPEIRHEFCYTELAPADEGMMERLEYRLRRAMGGIGKCLERAARPDRRCPRHSNSAPPARPFAYHETMALKFTASYLEDSLDLLRYYKKMAERAMEQVAAEQLYATLDGEMNSIAVIVKHMTGNMRSRWTDFLDSDGEKANRDRDSEFVDPPATREALMQTWDDGWARVFAAIEPLTEADLGLTVMIRGEAHSVMQAINRQLAHYASHIGQIVLLAKHFAHDRWNSLSIPRNRSADFNRRVAAGESSQR